MKSEEMAQLIHSGKIYFKQPFRMGKYFRTAKIAQSVKNNISDYVAKDTEKENYPDIKKT